METERTRDRRELREKRLAYFDKLFPHPPLSTKCFTSDKLHHRGTNPSTDDAFLTKKSKQAFQGKSQLEPSVFDSDSGARLKVRNRKCKDVSRNTHQAGGNEATAWEDSLQYEYYATDRMETGWSKEESDNTLETFCYPAAAPENDSPHKNRIEEHPPSRSISGDLYHVEKVQTDTWPWARTHESNKEVIPSPLEQKEHNAFGVDRMLDEMKRVRKVKAQLQNELLESLRKWGSISEILARETKNAATLKCSFDEIGGGECKDVDDIEGWGASDPFICDSTDDGMDLSDMADHSENTECVDVHESSNVDSNHSMLEDSYIQQNTVNQESTQHSDQTNIMEKRGARSNGLAWTESKKFSDTCSFNGRDSIGIQDRPIPDQQSSKKGDSSGDLTVEPPVEVSIKPSSNGEDHTGAVDDEFNLGALCAAAKQGDDILKDYIKRLTQKILNKKDDLSKNSGSSAFSVKTGDDEEYEEATDEKRSLSNRCKKGTLRSRQVRYSRTHVGGQKSSSASQEQGVSPATLSKSSTPSKQTSGNKVWEAAFFSEELDQLGYDHDGETDKVEVAYVDFVKGDIYDMDLSSDELLQQEDMAGFKTHRPSNYVHSPLEDKALLDQNRLECRQIDHSRNSKSRNVQVSVESDYTQSIDSFPPFWSSCRDTQKTEPLDHSQRDLDTLVSTARGDSEKLTHSKPKKHSSRSPKEHKQDVERHQIGVRVEEEKENDEEHEDNLMQGLTDNIAADSLKLRLSFGEDITGRDSSVSMFSFDEEPPGHKAPPSDSYYMERDSQGRTDRDDDESLLMQKISSFDPLVLGKEGPGMGGDADQNNNHRVSFCDREAGTNGKSDQFNSIDGDTSGKRSSRPIDNFTFSKTEKPKNSKRSMKSGRPASASYLRKSVPSPVQYKPRWPQSSSLIPTRPDKPNERYSGPESSASRRVRPSSAKFSTLTGSTVQRSRPMSAVVSRKQLKDPGAGGDFLKVRSSKVFDGCSAASRPAVSMPLTLKLVSESPRECQNLSIWQLLPDEILLCIFSHLKQSELVQCALVCQGFHRVAMDQSLWRYAHMEKRKLTDYQLTQIGMKHPVSVKLIQCNGSSVTENGLRNLFRTCVDSLSELNISGCTGEMFTGDSILLHASRCKHLTSVDGSWCNVTDNGLNAISTTAHRLSSMCLNGCPGITDTALGALIDKHGGSLKELELFGCINLSPSTLLRVGGLCRNLNTLNIGQCYKITDECIFEVIPMLRSLKHLNIRGCKQIRDDSVRRIARCCKALETLVLANCTFISNAAMIDIAGNVKSLRSLDVSGCKKITNEGVRSVAMCCTKLEALNLSSTSIDRKSISSLASYCSHSLRELKLNCCKDITEASIVKLLKHCRRMETLHLYGVKGLRNLGVLKLQYPCIMFDGG